MSKAGPGPPTPLKNAAAPPITPRMSRFPRLRARLALLGRSESGMALPVALLATVAAMALAGAAVVSTVDVQQGTKRDSASKRAIAAADAGVSAARTELARVLAEPEVSSCPGGALPSSGWCPPTSPETVGDATYSFQFSDLSLPCGGYALCVVATGEADGVMRRALVGFEGSPFDPSPPGDPGGPGSPGGTGGIEGLVGEEGVILSGSAIVRVGVGTNGDLVTEGAAVVCGDVRVGVDGEWVKSGSVVPCKGVSETKANAKLPSVESFMPADIATNNSNYRLERCTSTNPKTPPGCQSDTFSGSWSGSSPWNPRTRTISTSGATTLTLGGGDYWLCRLSMNGANQLIMAANARVRLFFDTPENCGLSPSTQQIQFSGANRIWSTGYQPGKDRFDMPGFYMLGSPTSATSLDLAGATGTNEFILYAPRTDISATGATIFKGVIAGRTVSMTGSSIIEHDDGFEPPPELTPEADDEGDDGEPAAGIPVYTPALFVECSGDASPTNPSVNC